MKNHRFLWLRNRTTDNRKCEKARNIKEKRTIEMFNTYSPQNGVILLVMAFLISPMGLPLAAIWLLGKVQSLKFAIQDWVYG